MSNFMQLYISGNVTFFVFDQLKCNSPISLHIISSIFLCLQFLLWQQKNSIAVPSYRTFKPSEKSNSPCKLARACWIRSCHPLL